MAGKISLGGAYIKLSISGAHIVKKAFKDISDAAAGLRKAVGTLIKSFVAFGAILGGLAIAKGIDIISSSIADFIKQAMEMEEIMARFNQAFGESAEEMKTWGDAMAKAFGRSKKDVSSMLVDMKNLFDALGWDDVRSNQMVKILSQDIIDAASYRDLEASDAFDRLRAALTGSSETMKLFGSILNETAIRKYADELGMAPGRLNEDQKVYLRARKFHEDMKKAKAIGDAVRTRGSATNSVRAMKAAYEDLAVSLGYKLLPAVQQFAQIMEWMINEIGPTIDSVFANIVQNGEGLALTFLNIADSILMVIQQLIKMQKLTGILDDPLRRQAFTRAANLVDVKQANLRRLQGMGDSGLTDIYRNERQYAGQMDSSGMMSVSRAKEIARIELQAAERARDASLGDWGNLGFEKYDAAAGAIQQVRNQLAEMRNMDWQQAQQRLASSVPQWDRSDMPFPELPEAIGEAVATAISKQTETSVWQKWADEVAENGKILTFMKGSLVSIDRKTLPTLVVGP